MSHGAKDKGNTTIDHDGKIAENMEEKGEHMTDGESDCDSEGFPNHLAKGKNAVDIHRVFEDTRMQPVECYSYIEGDSDSDSDSDEVIYCQLVSLDRVFFEAEPFIWESHLVYQFYHFRLRETKVNIESKFLEMLSVFCKGRAEIEDDYGDAEEIFIDNKLNEFNSKFLTKYRSHAIELVTAAFELGIKSLIDLMMEEVDQLFTKMEEVEVDNFFFVNFKENNSDDFFQRMNEHLLNNGWAFETNNCNFNSESKEVRANDYWNPELLKLTFNEYKVLTSYEDRRQWLIAHFLLRRSPLVLEVKRLKAKSSVMEEGTSSQTMANTNISDIMSRL